MLKAFFNFLAEAREDRLKSQTDYYAHKSRELDSLSKNDLRARIQRDKLVQLNDVAKVFKSLSCRSEYSYSNVDFKMHIEPIFIDISNCIKRHAIECNVRPYESIMDGYIKAGDLIDIVDDNHIVPDKSGLDNAKSIQSTPILVEPEYSKGSLGEFQKYMHKNYPIATPSAKVRYEETETDKDLDLKRPLILALFYSQDGREHVKSENIPLYSETTLERSQYDEKRSMSKTYRGRKY
jgi:hypothetical protein